jgi:hypothetical protein
MVIFSSKHGDLSNKTWDEWLIYDRKVGFCCLENSMLSGRYMA